MASLIKTLGVLAVFLLLVYSCKEKEEDTKVSESQDMAVIEAALDQFVSGLQSNPPHPDSLSSRIRSYLGGKSGIFYGSTVSLLDSQGKVFLSPYLYRKDGVIMETTLMDSSYHIDQQAWLRLPIDTRKAIWTEPYFDAGGGEIWMRTRSVPVLIKDKIVAVATTDLPVEKP